LTCALNHSQWCEAVAAVAKSGADHRIPTFPPPVERDIQRKIEQFTNQLCWNWQVTLEIAERSPGRSLKELAPMFSLSTSSIRKHLIKAEQLGLLEWPDHFKPVTKVCFQT
jgi:hypothetical protein